MYTTELVRRIARETGLSQRVVAQVLRTTLAAIQEGLATGEPVTFPGFGTFYTSQRHAGRVRSVRTGRQVDVPARRVAAFRVGAVLKRAVAAKRQHGRRLFGLGR
jgi:DNA-binding protein HU-beta